jgi:hypothetical protein
VNFTGKLLAGASLMALTTAVPFAAASAKTVHLTPLPGHAGHVGAIEAPYKAPAHSSSGTWQKLKSGFPGTSFPDTSLLLTDGTVLMHDGCTSNWYKLTPDNTGSYVNGTWKKMASMPSGYQPLYFASEVLPDGRLIAQGGEYNACSPSWTKLGALYDPVGDTWVSVAAPSGWNNIGDAQSVVLNDGTYMLANCCAGLLDGNPLQAALAKIKKNKVTWTETGSNKLPGDFYDEEGWTILPDGTVLTVDAWIDTDKNFSDSEVYSESTGSWSPVGHTSGRIEDPSSLEVGPAIQLPSGKVFQIGANSSGSTNTTSFSSLYDPASGTWSAGPNLPTVGGKVYSAEDAPAALLPGGNVLVQLSPAYTCGSAFCAPSHFFEYDGTTFTQVSDPADAPSIASYQGRLLVLPSGQVLWSSDTGDIEVYTPQGTPQDSWRPTITSSPRAARQGSAGNVIQGTLFNGLSFGGTYGDDVQMHTNYPIVQITNNGSGHVCYARTHDHSRMGIETAGSSEGVSTKFDVPSSCETGKSKLVVIANGIASSSVKIKIK